MTRQQIQEKFSAKLREKLRLNYNGAIPSAALFATHFNLRLTEDELSISQETARRWIRGCCLPDAARQQTLATWLGLDLNEALCGLAASKDPMHQSGNIPLREVAELLELISPRQREALIDLLKESASPGFT